MLSLSILLITIFASSAVLFLYMGGKLDKKDWRYTAILAVIALVTGAIGWVLIEKVEISLFFVFLICLAIFLVVGGFHTVTMYDLFWTQRDPDSWEKDSLAKEAGFTLSIAAVMVFL